MKQWSKIGNADSPACVPQDPGGSDFCDGIQFRGTSGIAAETENRLRLAEIIAETNGHRSVQTWFQDPQLEDGSPARMTRAATQSFCRMEQAAMRNC